ncbi:MAG: type II toxin-antitoxin system YafQ family toxin [Ruminococcus sp.]|jgi:mRNA interferase YafQ|nr:type II toxin-antitoxin system YafQ family toxin [Ruminococcus sp.]
MIKMLQPTHRYLKDLNKLLKRDSKQYDMDKLRIVTDMLKSGEPIPPKYENHPLRGQLSGFWGLHITPDWVLVYGVDDKNVYLQRMGTHSDIYG